LYRRHKEAKRKSIVRLIPYEVWLGEFEQTKSVERQTKIAEIQGKKVKRSYDAVFAQEMKKRLEKQLNAEEVITTAFMAKVETLVEKNGVARTPELYNQVLRSVNENKALPILFVWGPPYEGQGENTTLFEESTPESEMAQQIEKVIFDLSVGINIRPILIFADSYGIEINGMHPNVVQTYLNTLRKRFCSFTEVIPWSFVRAENREDYENFVAEAMRQNITVSDENIHNATQVQAKLGRSITQAVARSLALQYKKERLAEGLLLTKGFWLNGERVDNVIKLATAPSRFRNDEPYEEDLPRMYIKNMTRAAWNRPRR
jgi:hypothetical protein